MLVVAGCGAPPLSKAEVEALVIEEIRIDAPRSAPGGKASDAACKPRGDEWECVIRSGRETATCVVEADGESVKSEEICVLH